MHLKLSPRRRAIAGLLIVAAVAIAVVVTDLVAVSDGATSACTRYAAPSGKDRSSGNAARPFKTVAMLIRHLGSGQVGCLRRGAYYGKVAIHKNGITLRSASSHQATIRGVLEITGDHVTVQGVTFMNNVIVGTGQAPAGSQPVVNMPTSGWSNNVVTTGSPTFFTTTRRLRSSCVQSPSEPV